MSMSNKLEGQHMFSNKIEGYIGDINEFQQRHGDGFQRWEINKLQKYYGKFLYNNLHVEGKYTRTYPNGDSCMYEGALYANKFEGYGSITLSNCTYFEGLFKDNKRYGPGVLSYSDGHQDVGLWLGTQLLRLSCPVLSQWVPKLATNSLGRINLLKYRKLVPITQKTVPSNELYYNNNIRNCKSCFFNQNLYDNACFGKNDCYIDVALPPQEQIQSDESIASIDSVLEIQIAIESLTESVEQLLDATSEELELIRTKCCILRTLLNQGIASKQPTDKSILTKKVLVTELLAWNNEEIFIKFLKHTFLHRDGETRVRFDVAKLLADRSNFGQPGTYECAAIAFLANCSEGCIDKVYNLLRQFDLNPDLCDSCGNAGIFFACARDRICIIKELCNFGANIDILNDEGLTPLIMCILRYLITQNQANDWQIAFLTQTLITKTDELEAKQWSPRASLLSIGINQNGPIINQESVYFKETNLFLSNIYEDVYRECNYEWLYRILQVTSLPQQHIQNFQKTYTIDNLNTNNKFLLNTNLIKPVKTIKKDKKAKKASTKKPKPKRDKSSKKGKKLPITQDIPTIPIIDESLLELENNLMVIYNTIQVLMHCGADPNIGEVPYPSLLLSIFMGKPNLLSLLLENGANPNITSIEENMTALHLLATLPQKIELIEMCKLLLESKANPNLRTNTNHWMDENQAIVGNSCAIPEDFLGKTPLHILSMRADGDVDYFNELVDILMEHGAKLDDLYLAHTPLTLAMLKGNLWVIKEFLKLGDDPNRALIQGMGVPLTLYVLKRFNTHLPNVEVCKNIINALVEFGANPLLPIGDEANLIDFMNKEHPISVKPIVDNKKAKKAKKAKKPKKDKRGKTTPQDEIKEFIKALTRDTAFKHYQCKALLTIINGNMKNTQKHDQYTEDLAKLLTLKDTERILKVLNKHSYFKVNPIIQFATQFKALEFVKNYGPKKAKTSAKSSKASSKKSKSSSKKSSSKASQKNKLNESNLSNISLTPAELILDLLKNPLPKWKKHDLLTSIEPEADLDETKYKICFYCNQSIGKVLLPCPKCGLIYFCSDECNKASIKDGTQHACNVLFYKDELARYEKCLRDGVEYIPKRAPINLVEAKAAIKHNGEQIEQDTNKYLEAMDAFRRGGGEFEKGDIAMRISVGGSQYLQNGDRISVGGTRYSIGGKCKIADILRVAPDGTQFLKNGGRISKGGTIYNKKNKIIGKDDGNANNFQDVVRVDPDGTQYFKDGRRISKGGAIYSKNGKLIGKIDGGFPEIVRVSKSGTKFLKNGGRISVGGTQYDQKGISMGKAKYGNKTGTHANKGQKIDRGDMSDRNSFKAISSKKKDGKSKGNKGHEDESDQGSVKGKSSKRKDGKSKGNKGYEDESDQGSVKGKSSKRKDRKSKGNKGYEDESDQESLKGKSTRRKDNATRDGKSKRNKSSKEQEDDSDQGSVRGKSNKATKGRKSKGNKSSTGQEDDSDQGSVRGKSKATKGKKSKANKSSTGQEDDSDQSLRGKSHKRKDNATKDSKSKTNKSIKGQDEDSEQGSVRGKSNKRKDNTTKASKSKRNKAQGDESDEGNFRGKSTKRKDTGVNTSNQRHASDQRSFEGKPTKRKADGVESKKSIENPGKAKRTISFTQTSAQPRESRPRISKSDGSIRSRSKSNGSCSHSQKEYLNMVLGRLPNKYQYFMQQLTLLFPDFDFNTLCFPFVCFTDGQLYYRFLDKTPIFCDTYTST